MEGEATGSGGRRGASRRTMRVAWVGKQRRFGGGGSATRRRVRGRIGGGRGRMIRQDRLPEGAREK